MPQAAAAFPRVGADGRPWWESFFGEDALLMYQDKDLASGEAEAKAILAALSLRAGASLLDVGCGNGRHAVALASKGHRVIGLDQSAVMLQVAKQHQEQAGVELELRQGDMRQLPLEGLAPVDGVISLFTSFGLFSDAENEQVARGMALSLARGGRLLLDLNNREILAGVRELRTWSQLGQGYLLDELDFDVEAKRFCGTRILLGSEGERRYPFDYRVYSEPEIRGLLQRVGLRVLAVYGSLDRSSFNARSHRMVVLAEKP